MEDFGKTYKRFKRSLGKKCFQKDFWEIGHVLENHCDMNIIFGERKNGKTYAVLSAILCSALAEGRPSVLIRRMAETIRPKNLEKLFADHVKNGFLNDTEYNTIVMKKGAFYLATRYDETREVITADDPFLYVIALNQTEVSKGTFPDLRLRHVLFDEFLTRDYYLPNEFINFINTLSTVIRNTEDTIVWLVGNTVNWTSPYFRELGLTRIYKMKQGSSDIYHYQDDYGVKLSVYVEYTENNKKLRKLQSNKWFAFNNPSLRMITDGKWELSIYPHPKFKNKQQMINRDIYLMFDTDIICLEIKYDHDFGVYCLARPYIKDEIDDRAIRVYTDEYIFDKRYTTTIDRSHKLDNFIWNTLYKNNRFLYADNTTGETVRNFLRNLSTERKGTAL